jgi:MoxR-like ATPase
MKAGGSLWEGIKERKEGVKEKGGGIATRQAGKKEDLENLCSNMEEVYKEILSEMGGVIAGQREVISHILISIFTRNHALLEGYPGLGKTLIVSTLARIMDLKFRRIQCTPDLMPSDITGTYVVEEEDGKKVFRFENGPVFTNILLADEINRATPKTQSALLEAMQERQVTVGTCTFPLDKPFFVLATQNPIEMEGTYPLPEAQVDRFLMKILVKYPQLESEDQIIDLYTGGKPPTLRKIMDKKQLLGVQELTRMMPISNGIKKYVLKIVVKTRPENDGIAREFLDYGASPRASIGLILAGKARALIDGRDYVSRGDIEEMAYPVLRHRLILNFDSERRGITTDNVIKKILKEAK